MLLLRRSTGGGSALMTGRYATDISLITGWLVLSFGWAFVAEVANL